MAKKLLKRSEVNLNHTWDLTRLFKTEQDYEDALNEIEKLADKFLLDYKGKITTAELINRSLDEYRNLKTLLSYVQAYQSLHIASDQTNEQNTLRSGNFNIFSSGISKKIVFYLSELQQLDESLLETAKNESKENERFLEKFIKGLKHKLSPEVKEALSEFESVFDTPYQNYLKFKLSDMAFEKFTVEGKEYDQSFNLFENVWSSDLNTNVRREAFENFYKKLGEYENGLANNYQSHVLKEKAHANLKGFDTVFDYLLDKQEVSIDLYNRQIDIIMEHLAPAMRKYVTLLKEIHGLDKLTYADLHLPLDAEFEPVITAEESREYSISGLALLGEDYKKMIEKSFKERWIDFPISLGKSTGGFCSSPYRKGSYILLNWNDRMNEVFVLAHELGHAGHFYFGGGHQNMHDTRTSMYFIEAPSTMNELIMAEHLKTKSDDPRFKRWVLSSLVARTYYHNCVTHLIEAYFQREVYKLVENKKAITAKVLNNLMLETIRKFWGDTVEVPEYAGRTWMRQPHYFMGLYPYTYSAGLTISTAAYENIRTGKIQVEDWLNVLRAGGTKKSEDLAKIAGVDLSTEAPLKSMIKFVSNMVDEIVEITKDNL